MATDNNNLLDHFHAINEAGKGQSKPASTGDGGNKGKGLAFIRMNTREGASPFDDLEWRRYDAQITADSGTTIFKQTGVEAPKAWSDTAVNIVASKYFHGSMDSPKRETSVRRLAGRVVNTITQWGVKDGYFRTEEDARIFRDELTHLVLAQKASFNSPVWFNCGVEERPQCSACFINSVEDTMESILDLAKTEGLLFKYGSGSGTNLSTLRSSRERLSTGGIASGPVSFMRGFDAFAGVIKSGGKTRRAAKMVILNIDHPDIIDFIRSKEDEEKKAWALIDAGYDGSLNGEAYNSVFFQNANHSVRVTDEFMHAVESDGTWWTRAITDGRKIEEFKAHDLMLKIAKAAWVCGDPGMQFDSTTNEWHTCKASGRINASNPCSEFVFLDNTSCNLASLNLLKFVGEEGEFDVEAFRHAVDIMITAQEIIVDSAGYPRAEIAANSNRFRPLGLGYANLGALLMALGIPYDSDKGRNLAATITAILTGQAYTTSAKIASEKGPFAAYGENRESMLAVIRKHREALKRIKPECVPESMLETAQLIWKNALDYGLEHGYRNAQATVLAPTGTIGLMMDCDTTGIEPELALVKTKKLSGGGSFKLVNRTVPVALRRLGYDETKVEEIVSYIDRNNTIEGAPHLREEHLPVFDCAYPSTEGKRAIHHMGHVDMMAAVQPFLSGAISKTVNLPHEITPEEIAKVYIDAWKKGVKAVAVYRDACKRIQPLSTGKAKKKKKDVEAAFGGARRHRLPAERQALTHKFQLGEHEGYITVGLYENGDPGEIFLVMAKEGSTFSGLMDCFATAISLALQYGVPLKVLAKKFSHTRFEPSGWTKNKYIPHAKSPMDYIFRWLASKFLPPEEQKEVGVILPEGNDWDGESMGGQFQVPFPTGAKSGADKKYFVAQDDAPSCPECGEIMVRNGSCYKCLNCGATSGCS